MGISYFFGSALSDSFGRRDHSPGSSRRSNTPPALGNHRRWPRHFFACTLTNAAHAFAKYRFHAIHPTPQTVDMFRKDRGMIQLSPQFCRFFPAAASHHGPSPDRHHTVHSSVHSTRSSVSLFPSISPRLKSRGHKYFINKSHMLSFVLQFKRGGTLQSTRRKVGNST